jgi:hypothetical protein
MTRFPRHFTGSSPVAGAKTPQLSSGRFINPQSTLVVFFLILCEENNNKGCIDHTHIDGSSGEFVGVKSSVCG